MNLKDKTRARTAAKLLLIALALSLFSSVILAVSTDTGASTPSSTAASTGTAPTETTPTETLPAGSFRFVVIPDVQMGCTLRSSTASRFNKVVARITNDIKPAFVLSVGDMTDVEPRGKKSEIGCIDRMHSNFQEIFFKKIKAADIPFFPSPGNHDVWFVYPYARKKYKQTWSNPQNIDKKTNQEYVINGPEGYGSYYSFDYGNVHFVSLVASSSSDLKDVSGQHAWLRKDLEAAKAAGRSAIFTFAHTPVSHRDYYTSKKPGSFKKANSRGALAKDPSFMKIVKEAGITAHFSGHQHYYGLEIHEGITTLITGMLGGQLGRFSPTDSPQYTFTVVDVVGDKWKHYAITGPDFDTSELPPAPAVDASALPMTTGGMAGVAVCGPGMMPAPKGSYEAIIASASASASASLSSTPAPAADSVTGCGSKVAAVGDSLTAKESYVRFLANLCGAGTTMANEDGDTGTSQETKSKRGETPGDKFAYVSKRTSEMQADFGDVLKNKFAPDTIIILGGTNDIDGAKTDVWKTSKENLRKMYTDAQAGGKRVVAVTIPPYKNKAQRVAKEFENLNELNRWIMSADNPAKIKVNISGALENPKELGAADPVLYAGDLVHPNDEGQKRIAEQIHAALTGAAGTPATPGAPGAPAAQPAQTICVPESILPMTLFDFIINSSAGLTTIVGIARQNIAIGISKEPPKLPKDAICRPITADMTYDIDFLKSTYGNNQLEVESQLQTFRFMEKEDDKSWSSPSKHNVIRVHRLIAPVLGCVEQEIRQCEEGNSYDFDNIQSYSWQALPEDPNMLKTSSFGISIDINPRGELLPDCVVEAFQKFGFRWGGDFEITPLPNHFEFMAKPSQIAIVTADVPPPPVTIGDIQCNLGIPPGLDSQSIGPPQDGSLKNGYEIPKQHEYVRMTRGGGQNKRFTFATVELAKAFMTAACLVKHKYGVAVAYGDTGKENGGEIDNHASHESGRDIDVYFIKKTADGYPPQRSWWAVSENKDPCVGQTVKPEFDPAANYDFLKAFVEAHPVKYIFLDCNIENVLKEYAEKTYPGEWEKLRLGGKIKHLINHQHHYHVRIECPEGDNQCRS
jgi:penicillin-insensitive murein endopeptidase